MLGQAAGSSGACRQTCLQARTTSTSGLVSRPPGAHESHFLGTAFGTQLLNFSRKSVSRAMLAKSWEGQANSDFQTHAARASPEPGAAPHPAQDSREGATRTASTRGRRLSSSGWPSTRRASVGCARHTGLAGARGSLSLTALSAGDCQTPPPSRGRG